LTFLYLFLYVFHSVVSYLCISFVRYFVFSFCLACCMLFSYLRRPSVLSLCIYAVCYFFVVLFVYLSPSFVLSLSICLLYLLRVLSPPLSLSFFMYYFVRS